MSHALLQAWERTLGRCGGDRAVVQAVKRGRGDISRARRTRAEWLAAHAPEPAQLDGRAVVFAAATASVGWRYSWACSRRERLRCRSIPPSRRWRSGGLRLRFERVGGGMERSSSFGGSQTLPRPGGLPDQADFGHNRATARAGVHCRATAGRRAAGDVNDGHPARRFELRADPARSFLWSRQPDGAAGRGGRAAGLRDCATAARHRRGLCAVAANGVPVCAGAVADAGGVGSDTAGLATGDIRRRAPAAGGCARFRRAVRAAAA